MSSAVAKTWKAIKPHVPMIQFKTGGRIAEKLNSASVSSPKPGDAFKGIQRNSVTEAMLPGKYSRKPITQVEMDAVELGGAHL